MQLWVPTSSRVIELLATVALAAAGAVPAWASEVHHFDIPEETASAAIRDFGEQAHVQILAAGDAVKGKKFHAVQGELSTEEALNTLLDGSGLAHKYVGNGSIALLPMSAGAQESTSGTARPQETGKGGPDAPGAFQLAQATPGQAPSDTSVENSQDSSVKDRKNDSVEPYQVNTPEVLIQGSKVLNVDVKRTEDDIQPYYIFGSEQIAQSGATTVEEFLKQRLTMNTTVQSIGQETVNTYGATSTVNLRGFGNDQTLILIDGRRSAGVALGDHDHSQPDINGIPLAAIERIEILPSSASAIYGASAVGGVINIVLKKSYVGGSVKLGYDFTGSTAAPITSIDATYGFSLEGGRTQVMIAAHYSDTKSLLVRDRPFIGDYINQTLNNDPSYLYSSTNPFLGATPNVILDPFAGYPPGTNLTLKNGTSLNSPVTNIPAGTSPTTPLATLYAGLLANAGRQNLGLPPTTQFQTGTLNQIGAVPRIESVLATIRREMTPNLDVFVEFFDARNESTGIFNPFYFFGFLATPIPSSASTNPFNETVWVNAPINTSVPPTATDVNVTRRLATGFIYKLPADWRVEGDWTLNSNSNTSSILAYDYGPYQADLISGALNPFVDTIAHPMDVSKYLGTSVLISHPSLNDFALRFSGPLGRLFGADPASATIGLEHRKEYFTDSPDYTEFPNYPADNSVQVLLGKAEKTDSVYAELRVPLVSPASGFPGLRQFDLQAAVRTERFSVTTTATDYEFYGSFSLITPPDESSVTSTSTNPTLGLRWKPVEDVAVRASYSTAFLPPNYDQLAPATTPSPIGILDPKLGNVSYTTQATYGGNPNLQPQKSIDWDAGIVFTPQSVPGLRLDAEWYQILQKDRITNLPVQDIVDDVYAGELPSSLVARDPTTGRITLVTAGFLNLTKLLTEGFDFTVAYRTPAFGFGTFDFIARETVIERFTQQATINSPYQEVVDLPSAGGPVKHRANATLGWEWRGWTARWTTQYYGPYSQGQQEIAAQGSDHIPSQLYHDAFLGYRFGAGGQHDRLLSNSSVQLGIKNVFNSVPPRDVFYSPYYYSPLGDPRLRSLWLSVAKDF